MRDTVQRLASEIAVVGPLIATEPGAHLVMHVNVSHLFVQRAKHRLASGEPVIRMPRAVLTLARLTDRTRLGRRRTAAAFVCSGGIAMERLSPSSCSKRVRPMPTGGVPRKSRIARPFALDRGRRAGREQ